MNFSSGWRKLAVFIATFALMLILAPAALAAGSYSDGLVTWTYSGGAITGATLASGVTSVGTLAIPEYVPSGSNYVPVTSVGGMSGIGTASVDTVIIPKYVTSIADNAFKDCANIKSFDLRCGGLQTIGSYAFSGITALTSIDLPDPVTSIGDYAFQSDTALTSIVIPAGVTTLNTRCFYKCSNLASVQLPDGLTNIGAMCFNQCPFLSTAKFPSGLKSIGNSAFSGCALTSVDLPDGISLINNYAFSSCSQLTEATIPSGALWNGAFSSCAALQRVTLGNGVTRLSVITFGDDRSLQSLFIPASVTFIDGSIVGGCGSLTDLTVAADNPNYCAEGNVIYSKDKTRLVDCAPVKSGAFTVPDTVTVIGANGFYSCANLTSITLPEALTSIESSAFNSCSALTRVVFRSACPTFSIYDSQCFYGCPASLVAYYPVKYAPSWSSYSRTNKQAYANVTWELGDGSAAATTMENVNSGLIAAPADPVRDGYAFAGWYDGASDTAVKWDFAASTVTDDLTLYAHWTAIPCTITFDSKGGSAIDPITADYGSALTAPANPTWEGHIFLGWNPALPAAMPAAGAILTAQWTTAQCTITFDSNGGSAVASITADYDSAVTAPLDPTRKGYTFAGWDPAFPAAMPANGAQLTAKWTPNRYTVTFDLQGGDEIPAVMADYGTKLSAPERPVRDGYYFEGWFVDPHGIANWNFNKDTVTGDLTIYAYWTAYTFIIGFTLDGGSEVEPIYAECGSALTAPADPTREGYTFAGWDPAFPATMPANGAQLTAKWTVNQYTILFDTQGGSAVESITADYDSALTTPADPTKEGYTFAGWDPAFPATMPANGAQLTAQWAANQYTITFDGSGGSAIESITADYDSALTAPADPTKDGYSFVGWDPAFPAVMPLNGAALTAQWTVNQYTITFDGSGGSAVESITADYGSALTAPADPTKEGYTFAGWDPTFPATMPVEGAELLAQWTANDYAYSVVYYYGGVEDESRTVSETAAFGSEISTYPDKRKAGYKLDHDTAPLTISVDPAANILRVYYVKSSDAWVLVAKITLATKNGFTMVYKGETVPLGADILPINADDQSLTWKSSNTRYATVNQLGEVTGKSAGKVTITATAKDGSGVTAGISLTVATPEMGIKLSESSAVLYHNTFVSTLKTLQLTATATPRGTLYRGLTWSVASGDAATVNESTGMVTALKEGTAIIRATTDKGHYAECTVVVRTLPTTLKLNTTEKTLAFKQSFNLGAEVVMDGTESALTWSTSNAKVATVSSTGVVKAGSGKTGSATITARTKNGLTAACVVTVVKALPVGISSAIVAMAAQPTIGLRLVGGGYTTSNPPVADVAGNGKVTLKQDGTATLEAGGKRITVKVSDGRLVELMLLEGAELTLVSDDAIKWSAKDDKIASIDTNGRLAGLREGTTTIYGKAQSGWALEIRIVIKQADAAQATPNPAQTEEPAPVTPEPESSAEPCLP